MVISDRYHRQRLVEGIGDGGQDAICNSTVAIVGVGALGCMSATMLARAGVGHIVLIDRDIVEKTNLQRQVLFTEDDAKTQQPKATAAKAHLTSVNSEIKITAHVEDLTSKNITRLLEGVDVIVDGLDNFNTRYLLNDFSIKTSVPFMFAGVIAGQGNVMTIIPEQTPCLRCLFPQPPPTGLQETCDTVGVLAPAIGIAASCQCMDVIKFVTGNKNKISKTLLTFDLWNSESNRVSFGKPAEDCPCCGQLLFEFLRETSSEPVALCGRMAVLLPCIDSFDLNIASNKLQEHGSFEKSETMVRGEFNEERSPDGSAIKMICFHDGRAIIHGTDDIKRAKAIFERYVGN
ncbi:MAG: ThiF family adenylyltransferase [Planctomycetes bacterium]|nr:ThiF family adenylyltransferase [Planctomycetota bacterium]